MPKGYSTQQVKQWVQNGIDKSTIDVAYVIGWNLVAPENQVNSRTDKIFFQEKKFGKVGNTIDTTLQDINDKDKATIVNINKGKSLTTSQIRIAFGELRKIQMNGYSTGIPNFLMLKAKLAYAVKRHDKKGLTEFYNLFSTAYDEVDTKNKENGEKQFNNLLLIIEAVLAYHKYHGGKE